MQYRPVSVFTVTTWEFRPVVDWDDGPMQGLELLPSYFSIHRYVVSIRFDKAYVDSTNVNLCPGRAGRTPKEDDTVCRFFTYGTRCIHTTHTGEFGMCRMAYLGYIVSDGLLSSLKLIYPLSLYSVCNK